MRMCPRPRLWDQEDGGGKKKGITSAENVSRFEILKYEADQMRAGAGINPGFCLGGFLCSSSVQLRLLLMLGAGLQALQQSSTFTAGASTAGFQFSCFRPESNQDISGYSSVSPTNRRAVNMTSHRTSSAGMFCRSLAQIILH